MHRSLIRLAVLAAVVATAGVAACRGDSPTEAGLDGFRFSSQDGSTNDSIPPDTIPPDTSPPDTIPPDTIPPDTIPPDTIPPDTIPPDTIPPDTIPPDTIPPDTIPPDTIPPDTNTVRAFDLVVTVVGADSGGDTLQTVRLQGARVRLLRFDSLPDSSSVPNSVTPARPTNRNGMVTFHQLRPAWYKLEVSPPNGTTYGTGSALVAPATSPVIPVQVLLIKSP